MPTKDSAKKTKKKVASGKKKESLEKKKKVAKVAKVTKSQKENKNSQKSFEGKYFYAVGRRKTAIAKVKVFDSFGKEKIVVNGKNWEDVFTILRHKNIVRDPFVKIGKENQFCVEARIIGGGVNAQAEALRLGIARALVVMDEELRKPLRNLGFLTRDSRKVERKKAGLKKARRAPQWSKR